ncbi:hypothetical protein [Xylanimonas protaetiae]|uniref:Uncharacterized protein n=1 Tax=Xylanimonas protaetiae TaxID=2509457 RepID=A0A4P6F6V7_9MICO|nr:hypothetical protein [Xylanimonas protaetiae]QAY71176.1 hypothetical protein ET471_14950 [Xylanimonas protaetiae]
MTTQPGAESDAYDPEQDADADPEAMNPRTGAAAHDTPESDAYEDTDADPANMNPRSTLDELEE